MSDPIVLLLEGPDNGGKTTLAHALSEALDTRTVEHGAYPQDSQPWHRYAQSLIDAIEADDGHTVTIMERSWLSEFAYGRALRSYVRFDEPSARGLDRVALTLRSVVVNCCPGSVQTLDTEHHDGEVLEQIHGWYNRGIQQHTALPVVRYDREQYSDAATAEQIADEVLQSIDEVAAETYPETLLHELADDPVNFGLIGNPYGADTLIMGDKADGSRLDLPFFGLRGCAPWLSYKLDESSYGEADLCWFNVRTPDGVFKEACPIHAWVRARQAETGKTPRIFTLGAVASAWAESERLPVTRTVKHPQAHKRFSDHQPYPLIEILERAGD